MMEEHTSYGSTPWNPEQPPVQPSYLTTEQQMHDGTL